MKKKLHIRERNDNQLEFLFFNKSITFIVKNKYKIIHFWLNGIKWLIAKYEAANDTSVTS